MEIKAKVNFDFGKLARELPKAIKNILLLTQKVLKKDQSLT